MGSFKLGKLTLKSIFAKPETSTYPFSETPAIAGSRGSIEIDIDSCIFCGICEKRCPCLALEVNKSEQSWSIKRLQCIQCGHCVRECPKKCLRLTEARPSVACDRTLTTFSKSES